MRPQVRADVEANAALHDGNAVGQLRSPGALIASMPVAAIGMSIVTVAGAIALRVRARAYRRHLQAHDTCMRRPRQG
ncbi:hypothetical protein XMIN_4459 [Xanthomonas citri pv. mangiferaeindicae LMG 941]|nr:hypothetical protein Xcnt_19605 [Xanthomonas campestris pv. centellae]CCG39461.1 hypothetical protein XMIN_4459 [Xanthomonas citri pv. mangiferaeindicae LMG 941]